MHSRNETGRLYNWQMHHRAARCLIFSSFSWNASFEYALCEISAVIIRCFISFFCAYNAVTVRDISRKIVFMTHGDHNTIINYFEVELISDYLSIVFL